MTKITSNCLIVAGEKSGEEHCLSFFDNLKKQNPELSFWGVGGKQLNERGMSLLYDLEEFSSMGFSEVICKIPFYKNALKRIINEIEKRNTKFAILIDFQTFNLKLAKELKKRGVDVFYYVAPQTWVWKEYRVKSLRKFIHTLFCILPFEKKWFEDRGVKNLKLVEHPVFSKYKNTLPTTETKNIIDKKNIKILVLPGSRHFELKELIPEYSKALNEIRKSYNVSVRAVIADNMKAQRVSFNSLKAEKIYNDQSLAKALKWADIAFATSGTVTLTCGLFSIPTIVCYKTSLLNEFIFNSFVKYDGLVSLTNLILEKEVFPELIQEYLSTFNLVSEFKKLVDNQENYKEVVCELDKLRLKLDTSNFDVADYLSSRFKEIHY